MNSWLGLRHVALNVADVARARRFYVDLFGFRVEWEPDPDNVYLTTGQDNLALHRADGVLLEGRGALDHIGFVVTRQEDVHTWAERVRAHGARIVKDVRTHRDGATSFYLADPDGNVIQILHHPPLAGLPAGRDPRGGDESTRGGDRG